MIKHKYFTIGICTLSFLVILIGACSGEGNETPKRGDLSLEISEEMIKEALGNTFISAHVLNLDDGESANDVMIFTYYGNGELAPKKKFTAFELWGGYISEGLNITDLSGISVYYNLPPNDYQVNLEPNTGISAFTIEKNNTNYSSLSLDISPIYDLEMGKISFGMETDLNDLIGAYRQVGVIFHLVDLKGDLVNNAQLVVNDKAVGITNATGTFTIDLQPGNHTVRANVNGSYSNTVNVFISGQIKNEDEEEKSPGFGVIIMVISILSIGAFLYRAKK